MHKHSVSTRACSEEDLKCFQENSLTRHGKGRILGVLPLALTRSSLGLGQDDRGLVACLNLAFQKGSTCGA